MSVKFEISRSIYEDGKIKYIARNPNGVVRLRQDTLPKLQKAIQDYKPPSKHSDEDGNKQSTSSTQPESGEEIKQEESQKSKQFLQNDLQKRVQKKKRQSKKSSFWDNLK